MKSLFFMLVRSKIIWIPVLLVLTLNYVGKKDLEDAILHQNHYCQMVSLYKETSGQSGWPDYKKIYNRACID